MSGQKQRTSLSRSSGQRLKYTDFPDKGQTRAQGRQGPSFPGPEDQRPCWQLQFPLSQEATTRSLTTQEPRFQLSPQARPSCASRPLLTLVPPPRMPFVIHPSRLLTHARHPARDLGVTSPGENSASHTLRAPCG